MIERILLADSGTGHSEEILQALMTIPSIRRAMVTILHVVPPQISALEMEAKTEKGTVLVQAAIDRLKLDPEKVSVIIRSGDPKSVVCEVAEEVDTDLIIMGSRGTKNRLLSIFENSVSQYVFQLSPRPMLLVKDDIYVRPIQRVTVAMDTSEMSKKSLNLAMFLLRDMPESRLNLVHIDPNAKTELTGAAAEQDSVLSAALLEVKRY